MVVSCLRNISGDKNTLKIPLKSQNPTHWISIYNSWRKMPVIMRPERLWITHGSSLFTMKSHISTLPSIRASIITVGRKLPQEQAVYLHSTNTWCLSSFAHKNMTPEQFGSYPTFDFFQIRGTSRSIVSPDSEYLPTHRSDDVVVKFGSNRVSHRAIVQFVTPNPFACLAVNGQIGSELVSLPCNTTEVT